MTGTESELESLLAFLYAAPVGLVRAQPDGTIDLVNGAAMRLLLPLAAAPQHLGNLFDALRPVAGDLRDVVSRAAPAPGALVQDRRLVDARPGAVPCTSLSVYRLADGCLMAVLADATAQARNEEMLRAGEARLRFVLDAAAIGDWDLDLDSGEMRVQGAFERCLGQRSGDGRWTLERLMQAVHDDDRDAAYAAFDAALGGGGDWRVEVRLAPEGGPKRWLLVHGRVLGAPGRGWRMLGVVQDISDRRQAEDSRLEMQRLGDEKRLVEQSARMRTEFLARMSHEFRTPLNAIIGMTQLLRMRAPEAIDAQSLERIERAGTHLADLVDDVLDLARVDAGQLSLKPVEFELDAVLTAAIELLAGVARSKGLPLVLDAHGLPARLLGDPVRLKQALINLLANAVRLTERGHVVLRVLRLEEHTGGVRLHFEVEDTGPGIAAEAQARLFQPYAQLHEGAPGGTGLGLAVTRQIARLMGGDVAVRSVPGIGSTFWFDARFELPASGAEEPGAPFAGLRVLLVDEFAVSRDALAAQLRALGLRVDIAATTAQALERAHRAAAEGAALAAILVTAGAGSPGATKTLEILRLGVGAALAPILVLSDDAEAVYADKRPMLQRPATTASLCKALRELLASSAAAILPAAEPASARDRLRERHAGRRVLLVDDNLINQAVAQSMLESAGLVVELACQGEQAVEMALSADYDLVLMDIQMPVMDGLEATRQLREQLGSALPVVGFSANAYDEDREACLAAGMNDHLAKPVKADALHRCVLRWLDDR